MKFETSVIERRREIERIKEIFKKAGYADRDDDGYFSDLDFHGAVGDALIDVGKEKYFELKDEIYPYLNDIYPPFREDAVNTLGWRGFELPTFKDKLHEIWLNDPDKDVKAAALANWAGYYVNSKNPKVLKELYDIFISEEEPIKIRKKALVSLINVAGLCPDGYEQRRIFFNIKAETHEEFNQEVNWDLVNHIMKSHVPGWREK